MFQMTAWNLVNILFKTGHRGHLSGEAMTSEGKVCIIVFGIWPISILVKLNIILPKKRILMIVCTKILQTPLRGNAGGSFITNI